MPIFEYVCDACHHPFEAITLGPQKPSCPSCGGRELTKKLSTFAVGGRSAELPTRESVGACGTCGDPRGPGSCAIH